MDFLAFLSIWMSTGERFPALNFKALQKLYEGEHYILPFLAMQPPLALTGVKMRRADAREG
jgi:hypothetical protein